jgi:hypothetical protein
MGCTNLTRIGEERANVRTFKRATIVIMNQSFHIAQAQPAPPCTVVIFGASGDLARRKLISALYNLRACGQEMPRAILQCWVLHVVRCRSRVRRTAHEASMRFSRLEVDPQC